MKLKQMKDILKHWIRIQSWTSTHHLDSERFHKSLKMIFDQNGFNLDINIFQETMHELIEELYPDYQETLKEELVLRFSLKAEEIASFLDDTK